MMPYKRPSRMLDESTRRETIDESKAAFLLALPREQLREICEFTGLGRLERERTAVRLVFTTEEFYKLCRMGVGPAA